MKTSVIAYVLSLGGFLALDAVWLTVMASRLYKPLLGDLLLDRFALGPALAFYALYGVGIVVFAVQPGLASGKVVTALMLGTLFGLVAYGTYDLTNRATLKAWPWTLTLADMAWGAIATGVASAFATWAIMSFVGR